MEAVSNRSLSAFLASNSVDLASSSALVLESSAETESNLLHFSVSWASCALKPSISAFLSLRAESRAETWIDVSEGI